MRTTQKLSAMVMCLPIVLLTGCEPLSLAMLGAGANAGVTHTITGASYRTFTEPMPKVKKATILALRRMAIKVESTRKQEGNELIVAKSTDREIEVELEPISSSTTRMRSVARHGVVLMDAATAKEIVAQTSKALGGA